MLKNYTTKLLLFAILATGAVQAQWTYNSGGNDFDGTYKTSSVSGRGNDYLYNNPILVVNKWDKTGAVNLYISNSGYWSERSGVRVKIKFDNDETIYNGWDFSYSRDNKTLFLKSFEQGKISKIEMIGKMRSASSVSIRISNDYGQNDMKFSLSGSTKAINFVLPDLDELIVAAVNDREIKDKLSKKLRDRIVELKLDHVELSIYAINKHFDLFNIKKWDSIYTKPRKGVMYKKYRYVDLYVSSNGKESKISGTFNEKRDN